jgi:hypothetical protein
VLIRVWILLIESKNAVVEAVGGVITFLLMLALILRYRMGQNQEQGVDNIDPNHRDIQNPDLALLQAIFRTPARGLNSDIINSLHCFYYTDGSLEVDEKSEHDDTAFTRETNPPDIENQNSTSLYYGDNMEPIDTAKMCSICLSEYAPNELILMLPCRHTYHCTCVTEWLHNHTQCPLCKQDVLELLDQRLYVDAQVDRLRAISADRREHIIYDADSPQRQPPSIPGEGAGAVTAHGAEVQGAELANAAQPDGVASTPPVEATALTPTESLAAIGATPATEVEPEEAGPAPVAPSGAGPPALHADGEQR